MKNLDKTVVGLVDAMFEDLASIDPLHGTSLIRTRILIREAFKSRGLQFHTITLPDCGKFLERSLRESQISDERPPYHRRLSNADQRPIFLHSLWARLFDVRGQLLAEPDDTAVFQLRQVYYLFRKLDLACDQRYTDQSVEDWISIENELPRSHPGTWDCDNPSWSQRFGHPIWGESITDSRRGQLGFEPAVDVDPYPWGFFRTLCVKVSSGFGELDTWAIRPKHGPGAVSERGPVQKYEFRSWPRKLDALFPADYFASHDFVNRSCDDYELPARMIAVPKTQKGPRLIACEPSAHQWIQGGIQRWLEEQVASSPISSSIDFRSQLKSQELALDASRTGRFATIDLSAASDRISTRLVEYIFQGNFTLLDALHACRSRSLLIPSGLDSRVLSDRLVLLRKFAPMGSACTFPVQTIIFTMIAQLAICIARSDWDLSDSAIKHRADSIRVFGDDIILPVDAAGPLVGLLRSMLLRVNEGKSFSKGLFREACGMDAFNGVDVTPAYIRQLYRTSSPETLVSTVECSNNLYRKGWWNLSDRLLKTVPENELKLIPVSNQVIGPVTIFTYVNGTRTRAKRWNESLHVFEHKILTVKGECPSVHGTGEAMALQYFHEHTPKNNSVAVMDGVLTPPIEWTLGQPQAAKLRKRVSWVYPIG